MTLTANTIAKASLTANEAASFLPLAAQAAIKGKADIDSAKAKGAAALAVMVAGLTDGYMAELPWAFDINGKAGEVHTHVNCIGFVEFGNDNLEWKRNSEGKVSREAQSAYKTAFQNEFFNLPESNAAVWTMASKAIPMARAIREEGMTATIENGALKLSGGNTERATAMAAAKNLSALAKVAKDETGTNRAAPSHNGEGVTEAKVATPEEITRAAVAIVKIIAKGEADACNATLSNLRAIAKLVASNPEAFADA